MNELSLEDNLKKAKKLVPKLRVIYTDVDGTIIGPNGSIFATADNRSTLYPAKALIRAKEAGIDIVMISGRSARQLFGDARMLGLKNYIAELGTQVHYDLGNDSHQITGKIKLEKPTLHETITQTGAPDFLLKTFKGYLQYHTPWSHGRQSTHVFRGYLDLGAANKLLDNNGYKDLQLIDNGIIKRRGNLAKDIIEIHAYHLLPKGIGKESGVEFDIKNRNLKKNETIAVGDALSDLSLAPKVGALFLVKNAISKHTKGIEEEIAKHKNVFITESKMGIGFAEVVFSFLGF